MTSAGVAAEQWHLGAFRSICRDWPAGFVRPGTPGIEPDFVVEAAGVHPLGVEHTRFYRTNDTGVPALRLQEGEQAQVRQAARALFEHQCAEPVQVRVLWSTHIPLTKSRRALLSTALADRLVAAMAESSERNIRLDYDAGLGQGALAEVDTVLIWRSTPVIGSHWGQPAADYVPDLSPDSIQAIIDKKNTKPKNYTTQCDALWLLIVAEGDGISSLHNLPPATRTHQFQSQFKRVVFFDLFKMGSVDLLVA